MRKRDPQISDLNGSLKSAAAIDTPQWRFIQDLGDVRSFCAHNKESEPTTDQINDPLAGVANITKAILMEMSRAHAPYSVTSNSRWA